MYHWPSFFSFQDPRGRQGSPRVPYSQTGTSINGRARSSDTAMGHRISVTEVVVWNRIGYLLRFSESRVHSMQPAARESLPPRIEDGFDRKLKICGVARHQREAVDLRGCGNEPIHRLDWPPASSRRDETLCNVHSGARGEQGHTWLPAPTERWRNWLTGARQRPDAYRSQLISVACNTVRVHTVTCHFLREIRL